MEDISIIIGSGIFVRDFEDINDLEGSYSFTKNSFFEDPEKVIGERGLRYKDFATKIAICAANNALLDANLISEKNQVIDSSKIAVIVCSTLGNLNTVGGEMEIISESHSQRTNPLSGPNLSSNNIAATIAIRYKLTGVNFTICNGSTSSLDAVHIGMDLLHSNHADFVLIIGSEPKNRFTDRIKNRLSKNQNRSSGAVAIVLAKKESIRQSHCNQETIASVVKLGSHGLLKRDELIKLLESISFEHIVAPDEILKDISLYDKSIVNTLDIEKIFGDLDGVNGLIGIAYSIAHPNKKTIVICGNNEERYKFVIIN